MKWVVKSLCKQSRLPPPSKLSIKACWFFVQKVILNMNPSILSRNGIIDCHVHHTFLFYWNLQNYVADAYGFLGQNWLIVSLIINPRMEIHSGVRKLFISPFSIIVRQPTPLILAFIRRLSMNWTAEDAATTWTALSFYYLFLYCFALQISQKIAIIPSLPYKKLTAGTGALLSHFFRAGS